MAVQFILGNTEDTNLNCKGKFNQNLMRSLMIIKKSEQPRNSLFIKKKLVTTSLGN